MVFWTRVPLKRRVPPSLPPHASKTPSMEPRCFVPRLSFVCKCCACGVGWMYWATGRNFWSNCAVPAGCTKIYDYLVANLNHHRKRRRLETEFKKLKKRNFSIKGFYWNSIGLSDLSKYRYISEAIRDQNLDFVDVMETRKQDMSRANLNRLSGGADFVWHCLPPRGRSGGIPLGGEFLNP